MISYPDVIVTLILLGALQALLLAGFLFELAGETVPGWHTISWWLHRDRRLRILVLFGIGALALTLIIVLAFHFASNGISR